MKATTVTESQIREIKSNKELTVEGYPIFNTCTHTLIDLTEQQDETSTNDMHTLSVQLPNGAYVTFCVIPFGGEVTAEGDGCIDISYYDDKRQTTVIAMNPGQKDQRVSAPLYTLTFDTKK